MKFTDAEIDSIALAIYNAAREAGGQLKADSLGAVHQPTPWRMAARAALAAREELLEVVGGHICVRGEALYVGPFNSLESASEAATVWRRRGVVDAHPVHVTRKRRKR